MAFDQERTQDLYEQIPGYPKPPLIPLPEPDDLSSLPLAGLSLSENSRPVIQFFLALSGFQRFQKHLPVNLENILRKVNIRGPGLFAPVIAATLAIEDDPREIDPFDRAATLIVAARQFYDDLISARLEPDRYKDHVLEMGQYPNLFSTHLDIRQRRPTIYKSRNTASILVIRRGNFFILETGEKIDPNSLANTLREIDKLVFFDQTTPLSVSPGLLTCATDKTQIHIFTQMQANPTNARSLELIRNTFITLCLDLDDNPDDLVRAAFISQSQNLENRWHHASVQLVVFGNSKACLIGNFSAYLDGNVQMRATSEFFLRACRIEILSNRTNYGQLSFQKLEWVIDNNWISIAQKELIPILDTQKATFTIENIGRDRFIAHKLDPVACFILALAECTHKITGRTPQIAQFISLSRYRCMDVDSPYITTPELARYVEFVQQKTVDAQTARELIRSAISSQAAVLSQARHSLSLSDMVFYYLWSLSPIRQLLFRSFLLVTMFLLRKLNMIQLTSREVVVSHPGIYPGVPIVGRPGVRLPYTRLYGLHYQIFSEQTIITMMPGINWETPNQEFISHLRESLLRVLAFFEDNNA